MNKYEQFRKSGSQDTAEIHARSKIAQEELDAARMRKPGYRRRMRHTNNKHTKSPKPTSD